MLRFVHLLALLLMCTSTHAQKYLFFGDSNTEAGNYPEHILDFLTKKDPASKIEIVNAGLSGDVASRAYYTRFEKEVLEEKPEHLFILFGLNDLNWGHKPTPRMKRLFLTHMETMVREALKSGVKNVYVLNYPTTQKAKAWLPKTAELAGGLEKISLSEDSYLQKIGDELFEKISQVEEGGRKAQLIDVQRPMRAYLQKLERSGRSEVRLTQEDGVHLNALGNEVLATAILKGMGENVDPLKINSADPTKQGAPTTWKSAGLRRNHISPMETPSLFDDEVLQFQRKKQAECDKAIAHETKFLGGEKKLFSPQLDLEETQVWEWDGAIMKCLANKAKVPKLYLEAFQWHMAERIRVAKNKVHEIRKSEDRVDWELPEATYRLDYLLSEWKEYMGNQDLPNSPADSLVHR